MCPSFRALCAVLCVLGMTTPLPTHRRTDTQTHRHTDTQTTPASFPINDWARLPMPTLYPCPSLLPLPSVQDYLTDDDFLAAFKMTRAKFASEPGWRQKHMKKNLKLV